MGRPERDKDSNIYPSQEQQQPTPFQPLAHRVSGRLIRIPLSHKTGRRKLHLSNVSENFMPYFDILRFQPKL